MREIRFTGEQFLTRYMDRINIQSNLYRHNEQTFKQSNLSIEAIDTQATNMIYALKDFYLISEEQADRLMEIKEEIYKTALNRLSITKEVRDSHNV